MPVRKNDLLGKQIWRYVLQYSSCSSCRSITVYLRSALHYALEYEEPVILLTRMKRRNQKPPAKDTLQRTEFRRVDEGKKLDNTTVGCTDTVPLAVRPAVSNGDVDSQSLIRCNRSKALHDVESTAPGHASAQLSAAPRHYIHNLFGRVDCLPPFTTIRIAPRQGLQAFCIASFYWNTDWRRLMQTTNWCDDSVFHPGVPDVPGSEYPLPPSNAAPFIEFVASKLLTLLPHWRSAR